MTLFDRAGGAEAMLRLSRAMHARCRADPLLQHPFSRPDQHPQHTERLAAYLGEVLGGPPAYTALGVDQAYLQRMHVGQGVDTAYQAAFARAFDAAVVDALAPDEDLRTELHRYMSWAVDDMNPAHDDPALIPDQRPVPRWDGPPAEQHEVEHPAVDHTEVGPR